MILLKLFQAARDGIRRLNHEDDDEGYERQRTLRNQHQQLAPALSAEERQHRLRFSVGDAHAASSLQTLANLQRQKPRAVRVEITARARFSCGKETLMRFQRTR
jgi:hypothetical protein